MYHTIILVGNLGKDPDMRFTPGGEPVTSFSVAVTDGFGDKKKTIWFRVSAWGKQAEACNEYLRKGSKVLVEGRLTVDAATGGPRVWEKDGKHGASFDVSASAVKFMSGKGDAQSDENSDVPF